MIHQLPATTIELIRKRKSDGFSLADIAKEFGCAKSTTSLYCRDLFYHPLRKYATEKDARQIPIDGRKGKPHKKYPRDTLKEYLRKMVPCVKCGKPRQCRSESGLCIVCHRLKRRENARYQRRPRLHGNIEGKTTPKKHAGCYPIGEQCAESPTRKHSCTAGYCLWCSQFIREERNE